MTMPSVRKIDPGEWMRQLGRVDKRTPEERAEAGLAERDGVIPATVFDIGGTLYTFVSDGNGCVLMTAHISAYDAKEPALESVGVALELAKLAGQISTLHYDVMVARDMGGYERDLQQLSNNAARYHEEHEKLHRLLSQQFFPLTNLIRNYIADFRQIPPPENPRRIDGYVYILRSDSGYWKIGRAKNPANRLKTFTVKLPFVVNYEMVIPSTDYAALEQELHARFDYCRVNGEWFELTDGDIADLKREFENVAEQFNE